MQYSSFSLAVWWLYLLVITEVLYTEYAVVHSFVKQLLIDAPVISSQQTFWRRSPLTQPRIAHYDNFTLTLTRSLEVPTPSYVQILNQGSLSVTSFSLLRRGSIMQFDLNGVRQPRSWDGQYVWPNELSEFRDKSTGAKVMLVADGFLMPGQDDGGIYAILDADDSSSAKSIRITQHKRGWFYHRAVHVVLPDGKEGILTARARKRLFGTGMGELVWLNMPASFAESAKQLDGAECVAPWEETVLESGPDVMFEVLDMNTQDDCIEVISAHFFGKKLSVHSLRSLPQYPHVHVVASSSMPTTGRPYGLCLATFTPTAAVDSDDLDSLEDDNDNTVAAMDDLLDQLSVARDAARIGAARIISDDLNYHNQLNNYNYARPQDFQKASFHQLLAEEADSWQFYAQEKKSKSINKVNRAKYKSSELRTKSILQRSLKRSVKSSVKKSMKISHKRSMKTANGLSMATNTALCDNQHPTHILVTTHECKYDFWSALDMIRMTIRGSFPVVKTSPKWQNADTQVLSGGSLFAYEIPSPNFRKQQQHQHQHKMKKTPQSDLNIRNSGGKSHYRHETLVYRQSHSHQEAAVASDISSWERTTICSGFKVRGWGGIFAPGAPGFPYVFRMPRKPQSPPLILLAGDCTGSAYIFAPINSKGVKATSARKLIPGSEDFSYRLVDKDTLTATHNILSPMDLSSSALKGGSKFFPSSSATNQQQDQQLELHTEINSAEDSGDRSAVPNYELVFEIECGATVGSATVSSTNDGTGDVFIYIPAYELNKVHVFRLSDKDLHRER